MNNNKQSSSIDLLWEIAYNRELTVEDWKQAKAMHKEESISYAEDFAKQMLQSKRFVNAEIIYNETYGGNK